MAVIRDSDSGQAVAFGRHLRVGRGRGNDLVIPRDTVSTHHAAIEWRGDGFYVRDLGSRNGTAVDGERVLDWHRLLEGAAIRFGPDSVWRVEDLAPPAAEARPPTSTVDAGGRSRALPTLHLELLQRGEQGDIVVRQGLRTARFAGHELRFALLWVLADALVRGEAPDGWVDDEALRAAVWGRRAAEDQATSTLAKLVHDTRAMLAREGIDGAFIEKLRGRSRLRLRPEQVTLG